MEFTGIASGYIKGLMLVLLLFPLFTLWYDRAAFKQPFWFGHFLVIMLFYPVTLPLLLGMRANK